MPNAIEGGLAALVKVANDEELTNKEAREYKAMINGVFRKEEPD